MWALVFLYVSIDFTGNRDALTLNDVFIPQAVLFKTQEACHKRLTSIASSPEHVGDSLSYTADGHLVLMEKNQRVKWKCIEASFNKN